MSSTEPRVHSQINEYQARQRSSRLWHKIVSALACVVVFCTTYALILPAITMETPRILDCPLEVHSHTPDCYDADGDLICGQADFVVHTHTQSCYGTDGGLVCLLPEIGDHTHTDDCYTVERLLICDLDVWEGPDVPETPEETVVHEHGESCYAAERGALICNNGDGDHEHTDECYERVPILTCGQEESAGHAHDENCYTEETALLCGLEETAGHEHDANCYTTGRGELICGSEDEDHTHTDECYEQISVLSCNLEEGEGAHTHQEECLGQISLLSCGLEEGEGAHTHTVDCRLLICGLEEGERVPAETEPAQADSADQTGTDTDAEAAPTSEKVLGDGDAEAAPTSERVPGHIHTDECYEITRTLTCDTEEIVLHTHTGACYEIEYDEETGEELSRALICGQLEILEHVHTDECFVLVEDSAPAVYSYEDETIAAEVTLAEGSALPEGTELVVCPITGTTAYSLDGETGDDGYEDLVRRAEEAVGQPVTDILLYDISFYTPDGEYLPVEDSATVSLRFKEAVFPEGTGGVTVLHYAEDGDLPVALDSVDVERDENDTPAALTFQTEGFSVYAVVTVTDGDYQRITDVKDLAGQNVAILSNGAKYAMTAVATTDNKGLQYTAVASTADLSEYTIWTFEQNTGGTYYISSNGSYLVMGNQTLTTTATKNNATAFTITIKNGLAEISASVSRTTYYINLFGGENSPSGFKSYTSSTGNLQQLYVKAEQTEDGLPFTGLDGKSYVIANLNTSARQYAMSSSQSGSQYLSASPVSIVTTDETAYVSGDDLTTWTFTATNTPGVYYIRADDTKQYLSLTSGALTTSDTPNAITVTTSSTYPGQVKLSANNTAVDWYGGSNYNNLVFGAYSGANQNNYQTLCQPLDASANSLVYDLNLPSMNSKGIGWKTEPTIESNIQLLSDAAALYAQPSGYYTDTGPAGIENLYRFNISNLDSLSTEPFYDDFDWYGEERFDGWTYTADGTTYLLAPGAEIAHNDDGTVTVAAGKKISTENGVETIETIAATDVTLPSGATLTGHWAEVSNVVTFFVNYKGTILDTEGNVNGRRSDTFTRSVAVGHVFYGKLKVGDDQTFGAEANQQITAAISPEFTQQFNPDNPKTQIVIEYLRECTKGSADGTNYETSMQLSAHGANGTAVAANTLKLLRETGRTIQIATGSGTNPTIDNSLCDEDHYEIRWYILKEQADTWHIDGVLVAKTSEIALAKTFSGLSTNQAQALLDGTDTTTPFQIKTKLGTGIDAQDYLNITAGNELPGQYEYSGSDATSSLPNSYHWTLHSITDETYTLTEENYKVEDYDVSSIVVHYYTDSTGTQRIDYGYGDSTSGDEFTPPVTGGQTSAVSFNNFYTPTGTGAMAIVKRDSTTSSTDSYGLLQGAVFTLYSDEACSQVAKDSSGSQLVVTTNANGTAYFSGLKEGTYYLKETTAPEGYVPSANIYKVVVAEVTDEDGETKVTVTLHEPAATGDWAEPGTTLYDGGIQGSFTVKNTANTSTITVVKTFSGLTTAEMDKLYQDSKAVEDGTPSGYYIHFQGSISGDGDLNAEGDTTIFLTLDQAHRSQDGFTFTWTIHNLSVGTQEDPTIYTITEHNYMLSNYVDVVVTAKMTDPSSETGEMMDVPYNSSDSVWLGIDRDSGTAAIYKAIFSASRSDVLSLSNHYTNTFELKLRKVDSNTGEALANAEFKIYGPYDESTNISDKYTYTDADGTGHTVYYIKTITSGTDGYASLPGLKLSNGENTFAYILDESKAPSGYAAAQPQVVTVTVDQEAISTPGGSNYLAGVLEYSAPNTKEEDYVHAALDTVKVWDPNPPNGATVTLELYRVTHGERNKPLADVEDAELVAQVTLDGTADNLQTAVDGEYTIAAYESASWTATWTNLYSASKDYGKDGNTDHYHYFVREVTTVNGYAVSYTCYDASGAEPVGAFQILQVTEGGTTKTFQGVLIADMDEAYTATVVNTTSFELPETGGAGTLLYAMGGAFLMAASLLYGYKLRRKSERRYRC